MYCCENVSALLKMTSAELAKSFKFVSLWKDLGNLLSYCLHPPPPPPSENLRDKFKYLYYKYIIPWE